MTMSDVSSSVPQNWVIVEDHSTFHTKAQKGLCSLQQHPEEEREVTAELGLGVGV